MKRLYCFSSESLLKKYANYTERHFVGQLKMKIIAGNGGHGCVSYHRDRVVTSGAPTGGDGGKGGDIYFKAVKSFYDLSHFKKPFIYGNSGKPGMKEKKHGKDGKDLKISVPVGTLVYEIVNEIQNKQVKFKEDGEEIQLLKPEKKKNYIKKFLCDLERPDQEFMVAKGGTGGKGNGKNIGIKEIQPGKEGQDRDIFLELKCLADVGLVGYPNAGKSTFLASVTRSLPKIAEYPFTTLNPMVGKVRFIDKFDMTIADIPGIIKEAYLNKGLGLDFLRHIERCKILVYLIDISHGSLVPLDYVNQIYRILRNEIECYNKDILKKPFLVIGNKVDLSQKDDLKLKIDGVNDKNVFLISAKHGYGVGDVLMRCREIMEGIQQEEKIEHLRWEKEQELIDYRKSMLEKELIKS